MNSKKTVAVMFGGQSAEHDVSVLTGIQICEAIDRTKYDVLPVYLEQTGCWYAGDALLNRRNYPLMDQTKKQLNRIQLNIGQEAEKTDTGRSAFSVIGEKGLLGRKTKTLEFDIAIPSVHGTQGEDGALQGLYEMAGIPYIGCRVLGAACFMDKWFSKAIFKSLEIPVLEADLIERPDAEDFYNVKDLIKGRNSYPVIAKPRNLGSSVGVTRADTAEELAGALATIFKLDSGAVIEPFVPNLVEYNVAVSSAFGKTRVSAIERPYHEKELLAFKDKYLAGGDMDTKLSTPTEGMASATREINPKNLKPAQKKLIEQCAIKAFDAVDGRGTARIDFLCNGKTGEIWLNEVNTFPGSLSYFLWEAASPKVSFTDLMTAFIEEGFEIHANQNRVVDPRAANANIFG